MTMQQDQHIDGLRDRAEHDGFFLVENLLSADECARYAERLDEYASGARPAGEGISIQREPELERAGQVRAGGGDIRKIDGLFHDDLLRTLISSEPVLGHMHDLVGAPAQLFRASALMKPAAVGSEKGQHQDSPYWPIAPMSLWSCWVPFDDATLDNGCLTVVPGSHHGGALPHVRTQDDYIVPTDHYDPAALVPVPMRRGTGLFFHSLLLHGSAANTSGNPRRAVTMSYLGPRHDYTGTPPTPDYPVAG
ncbi:ectoine hydroxylase-related dioxygenase (phytanoyl-CoA dioxygenase family) [Actinopolymorpha pittospori]|uniref:Ectoine hydroxylase-related dioxygenase (Phytanoyl-CoA dioxygenase family) n=2 Tax=Actinopolymorpha pittospori TaxID=648752 RepID=A0A927RJM6_9ACTN|nr:ectoine hydroxylase-related dioxygenase (phytanoyl-CoA dioxygenase family) [Actinopolymorpha pittospori]